MSRKNTSYVKTVVREWQVMIVQLEIGDMFLEKKPVKECATVTEEGWRSAEIGHKKTHSLERTHVLDSKVTLTHHKRNDAGREGREQGRKIMKRSQGKEEKKTHFYRFKILSYTSFSCCSAVTLSSCLHAVQSVRQYTAEETIPQQK